MEKISNSPTERGLIEGIMHYISILRKRWLLIVLITMAAVVGSVGFSYLTLTLPPDRNPLPNYYTATAVLLIQQQGTDIASSIMSALGVQQQAASTAVGFDTGALVIEVLSSRSFLDRLITEFDMIKRYGITENVKALSRERLLGQLGFNYTRTTGVLTISFDDTDPVFARDVVNRMVKMIDDWFTQNRGTAKTQQMKQLEEKVNEVKIGISNLENQLKYLQKKYGVLNAEDLGASQAASIADLRSQLILREIDIKNYTSFSVIDDPRLQQLKEERQNILDLIEKMQTGLPETVQSTSNAPEALRSLPDVAQEFSRLTLELEIQRRIYNTLSPQYEAIKLTPESPSLFQILEMAEAPDMKSGPQRSRIVMLAVIAAFAGSCALALFINMVELAVKKRKKTASFAVHE